MDQPFARFDWTRARAFLATAEQGSLSAAARALGTTQPTLGRQVAALEAELGVALFERVGRGLELTPAGLDLVEHARGMADAATRLSLAAAGRAEEIEGTITLTASEVYAAHILPPILARLRAEAPGITVSIIASNAVSDLLRREADIAIRNTRPVEAGLVARQIATDEGHFYATPGYLDTLGNRDGPDGFSGADFIGFDSADQLVEILNARGFSLSVRNFPLVSASQLVQWQMVRRGLGIGVMAAPVGDADPDVVRAFAWMEPIRFPVWLVAHRDVRTSRRVRLVYDLIAEELSRRLA